MFWDPSTPDGGDLPYGRFVARMGDMSRKTFLVLVEQSDGDVVLEIWDFENFKREGEPRCVYVEMCTSGGRSPETLHALRSLMVAVEKDNKTEPRPIRLKELVS